MKKIFFIIIGLILLVIDIIIYLVDYGNILEALEFMVIETVRAIMFGCVGLKHILFILGMVILILGLRMKEENISYKIENIKILVMEYKILRVLGYLPFIGVLCFAIYESIFGFTFLFTTDYGFEAFLSVIMFYSVVIWPLYIIGIVIIKKSSKKLEELEILKNQNINDIYYMRELRKQKYKN